MSKSYNMAGWRVGFCCGNSEMVKALATIKGYYDYGMFAGIQIASVIAMRECKETPQQQSKIYEHRRDVVCAAGSVSARVIRQRRSGGRQCGTFDTTRGSRSSSC